MSDQNFYNPSINSAGPPSVQSFVEAGDIDDTATVAKADTSSGAYIMTLPDQILNSGRTIVAVNVGGGNTVGVGVQSGDSLNFVVDASDDIGSAVGGFAIYISAGSDGWLVIS